MPLAATASPWEVLWTTVATIGLLVTLWGLWDAWGDLRYLQTHRLNGVRLLVAWSNVRSEIVRCAVLLMFTVVGGAGIILPLPYFTDTAVLTFVASSALLVGGSLWDRYDRTRLVGGAMLPAPSVQQQLDSLDERATDIQETVHRLEDQP